ncbi:hypothetical protein NTE_00180 [Candidatus Nitrososphaera evergladensis SR1]|uniref:Uncharacterized protein n=1 Tax=Candidatus Nitrososphaera evergladensis SR1 TaxID=1459636 RepID=A0A075MN86_9ARCH|nr:hypothetical protein NTE_00180 [Candidatus Nitrososphaera evergladensis SR1]
MINMGMTQILTVSEKLSALMIVRAIFLMGEHLCSVAARTHWLAAIHTVVPCIVVVEFYTAVGTSHFLEPTQVPLIILFVQDSWCTGTILCHLLKK